MTLPNHEGFMLPVLQVLADESPLRRPAIYSRVALATQLSEADMAFANRTGMLTYKNRIAWAITDLYKAGCLDRPARSTYAIAENGRKLLAAGVPLSRTTLMAFPQFREYQSNHDTVAYADDGVADQADDEASGDVCWFVGSAIDNDDQTARFIHDGVWENGYANRYLDQVKSMREGDRIAIKATYTRRSNLPFDPHGNSVSVMAIKATGVVTANAGDGRHIEVDWQCRFDPPREWYFYTHRKTVWRVLPGGWMEDALIDFAFNGAPQDYGEFCNSPYWRERYGDVEHRYTWTRFYEAMADGLLKYRDRRGELLTGLRKISEHSPSVTSLQDRFPDGHMGALTDICPFTVLGIFNRSQTDEHRREIAAGLAELLGVDEPVPSSFDGIPMLHPQSSWFFRYAESRQPGDIDALWNIFAEALSLADSEDYELESEFVSAFDFAIDVAGVKWNLTMGLFWIRPWRYLPLDGNTRAYLKTALNLPVTSKAGRAISGANYLVMMRELEQRFREEAYPVHSFPELSETAWRAQRTPIDDEADNTEISQQSPPSADAPLTPYGIRDIMDAGCFIDQRSVLDMLAQWRDKKNLILQGPPGTGKTWLARKLGYALIGEQNDNLLRSVQFHPNLSYEDFVRGYRPSSDGRLNLVDGVMLQMVDDARDDAQHKFVLVIEEINRGNPAQIFDEMLTLLEADKRTPAEAIELAYPRDPGERISIPDNLYIVGTMNLADRSLALVDLALRRRFAYATLKPEIGETWKRWVSAKHPSMTPVLDTIRDRLVSLNNMIKDDPNLGAQFQIGHSFVTPTSSSQTSDPWGWFSGVVNHQIGPLLDEYWFDDPERAQEAKRQLLSGLG